MLTFIPSKRLNVSWASAWVTIWITSFGVSNCLAEAGFDLPSALKKIKPSIVGIGTYSAVKRPPSTLMGTGFVIADGSLALIVNKTNHR
jgi:hypothetical protein